MNAAEIIQALEEELAAYRTYAMIVGRLGSREAVKAEVDRLLAELSAKLESETN